MSLDITPEDVAALAPGATRNRTCYVSGPMRGYVDFNFAAFDQARDYLEKRGWFVYSPADLDRFRNVPIEEQSFEECMRRDYTVIARSGAMFLLRGWENSTGANAELHAAKTLKLDVFEFEYDGDEIVGYSRLGDKAPVWIEGKLDPAELAAALQKPAQIISIPQDSEVRIVDPNTGGEKGQKLARFDLIPQDALFEVARVYGIGSRKYADRNWERGYPWGLSYGALQRHLSLDMQGEDMDPEGFYHLAAVAWHALALLAFRLRQAGTDDRGPVVSSS